MSDNVPTYPIDESSLALVRILLERNLLSGNDFRFNIYINWLPIPLVKAGKSIDEYDDFTEALDQSIKWVKITTYEGKVKQGKSIILSDSNLSGFSPEPTQSFQPNQFTIRKQESREEEIVEKVTLRVSYQFLEKDIARYQKEIAEKDEKLAKYSERIREAEKFEQHIDKLIIEMNEKGKAQNNKSLLDYATELEKAVPGILGHVLGINATPALPANEEKPGDNLAGSTAQPITPNVPETPSQPVIDPQVIEYGTVLKEIKKEYSDREFEIAMSILNYLAFCKEILPVVFQLVVAEYENKRKRFEEKNNRKSDPVTAVNENPQTQTQSIQEQTVKEKPQYPSLNEEQTPDWQ